MNRFIYVLKLIKDYLTWRGSECFTLKGLYLYYSSPYCDQRYSWSWVKQTIYELHKLGILRMFTKTYTYPTYKRRGVYCWTPKCDEILEKGRLELEK